MANGSIRLEDSTAASLGSDRQLQCRIVTGKHDRKIEQMGCAESFLSRKNGVNLLFFISPSRDDLT